MSIWAQNQQVNSLQTPSLASSNDQQIPIQKIKLNIDQIINNSKKIPQHFVNDYNNGLRPYKYFDRFLFWSAFGFTIFHLLNRKKRWYWMTTNFKVIFRKLTIYWILNMINANLYADSVVKFVAANQSVMKPLIIQHLKELAQQFQQSTQNNQIDTQNRNTNANYYQNTQQTNGILVNNNSYNQNYSTFPTFSSTNKYGQFSNPNNSGHSDSVNFNIK